MTLEGELRYFVDDSLLCFLRFKRSVGELSTTASGLSFDGIRRFDSDGRDVTGNRENIA